MKINWGCGVQRFHMNGWVNADIKEACQPDWLQDITYIKWIGPPPNRGYTKDNSVSHMRADNLLEHIGWGDPHGTLRDLNLDMLMVVLNEAHRVMKPDGQFWIRVPCVLNWSWGAFRDPDHKRFFCEGTFDYWKNGHQTYLNYGKSYGYLPWKVETKLFENPANQAVFVDAFMEPVK